MSFAQTPSFSPTALPPLPTGPVSPLPTAPATPGTATSNVPANPVTPALPDLAAIVAQPNQSGVGGLAPLPASASGAIGVATPAAKPENAASAASANPLANLPPPLPESSDAASAANGLPPLNNGSLTSANTSAATPLPSPPGATLPVPLLPTASPASRKAAAEQATALPEVNVASEKPKQKSWETVLAPTDIPIRTHFNYRRVVQPATIYRTQYDSANQHLPKAVSREEYIALLFNRVAANDVNGTRALLNTGISPSITDGAGHTPLAIARSVGANDTAALLVARGAQG